MSVTKVKRNVLFFDIHLTVLNKNTNTAEPPANKVEVITNAFNYINTLPFNDVNDEGASRYYKTTDGNLLYTDIDSEKSDENYIYGKFVVSRKSNFPDIEKDGVLMPLVSNIPEDSGLAEVSHFVYFKQGNILGYEFNFYAPRATALSYYIPTKARDLVTTFTMSQRLNMDADRKLDETGEVSLIDIAVFRNHINVMAEMDDNIHAALTAAAQISEGAEIVELLIRRKRHSRKRFEWPWRLSKERIKSVLRDADKRAAFERMVIKSETLGRAIDLLQDKMIVEEDFVLVDDKQKRILSSSAYDAIKRAYSKCFQ